VREALQTVVETAGYTTVKTEGANESSRGPAGVLEGSARDRVLQLLYIRQTMPMLQCVGCGQVRLSQYTAKVPRILDNKGGDNPEKAGLPWRRPSRHLVQGRRLKYDEHTNLHREGHEAEAGSNPGVIST